jgi:hypothetical protein
MTPEPVNVPPTIKADLAAFLGAMAGENVDTVNLGIGGQSREEIVVALRRIYGITD